MNTIWRAYNDLFFIHCRTCSSVRRWAPSLHDDMAATFGGVRDGFDDGDIRDAR